MTDPMAQVHERTNDIVQLRLDTGDLRRSEILRPNGAIPIMVPVTDESAGPEPRIYHHQRWNEMLAVGRSISSYLCYCRHVDSDLYQK